MDYKKINLILQDLRGFRRKQKPLEFIVEKKIDGQAQGEEGKAFEVYPSDIDGVFVKLTITTDSYGENENISGVQFVSPQQKTVTNYEPIN